MHRSNGLGQTGRLIQPLQLLFPEMLTEDCVLALQPGDVVAVAPGQVLRQLTGITLQYFTEQLRVAPAVHQDVVVGVDQVVTLLASAHQGQAQQGRSGQIEAPLTLGRRQGVQGLRGLLRRAPVVLDTLQADLLVHHLDRRRQFALPEAVSYTHLTLPTKA